MADQPGARGEVEVVEPGQLEQEFARRVAEAKATIPHAYAEIELDLAGGNAIALPAIVEACGRALREVPRMNGAYRDGRYELYSRVNIGFAVAAQGTLMFPVIDDADQKDAEQIAGEVDRLASSAREGSITQPDLSGGTFSVADPGAHGITRAVAVVNRGQSGFLAVGGGRGTATLTLSYDHRMHQGSEPLEFLARLRELLENAPD